MKKIIILSATLLFSGITQAQLSTSENYIYSKIYLSDPTLPNVRTSETVQYFDGLGKPKQFINIKATPTNQDLVTTIPYDSFGRQVDTWLPAPMPTLNGGIQSGVSGSAQTYYADSSPFTHNVLESSPLDRALSQVKPGTDWQSHPIQFGFEANADGEVKKYTTSFNYQTFESSIPVSTMYSAGKLYKNTVIDEDDKKTIEFKNGDGQVVLSRKMLNATEGADTYYVYNDYNQLAFVIPPQASILTNLDLNSLNILCYQYKYDGLNRLVEKKLPGKDIEYLVYDKADRLVATQDGNLRSGNKWLFNKYDKFGRVIYTGISIDTGGRIAVQDWINNTYGINTEIPGTYTQSGLQIPYGNNAYPQNIESILTVNFYDSYPTGAPAFTPSIANQSPILTDNFSSESNTKNLTLASYIKNIEDNNWTKNYTYYDTRGRAIATYSINYLGGYTQKESKLDYTGIVQQTITHHKRLASDLERVIDEGFIYDSQNRLISQTHKVDGNQTEIIAQNGYNEISQLTEKKLGGLSVNTPTQTINYQYNIRGWLTRVNDPANLAGKLFGYQVKYTNPEYTSLATPSYNGNIAEVDWKNAKDGILKRYSYQYDALNRLQSGFYSEPLSVVPQIGSFNESMTYDLNGNISTLQRNRYLSNFGVQQMDDLSYVYSGDQLKTVTDFSGNYFGYPDTSGTLIHYDLNGNMTDHEDKGMLQISYNHLNLPNYIKWNEFVIRDDPFFGGSYTEYVTTTFLYRADGTKLRKIHNYFSSRNQNDASTTTDYFDGFQYSYDFMSVGTPSGPQGLQFIPTSEGYYDFQQNKYIYQYKDYLNNIRLAFYRDDLGNAVIDRTGDYYPFGLDFGGSNTVNTFGSLSPNYTYSYQGQEKQQDSGWDSFKWRNYDPSMGRFFNVDPLAEKYPYNSTYAFQENKLGKGKEIEGLEVEEERGAEEFLEENQREYWNADALDFNPSPRMGIAESGLEFLRLNWTGVDAKDPWGLNKPIVDPNRTYGTYPIEEVIIKGKSTQSKVKTYQTYIKDPLDPTKDGVYSGRTSGTGTPEENVAKRDATHHMNETHGPARLDKTSTNKDAIRGREQKNIDANGGAKSMGGTSGNAINGIRPANPKRERYLKAAEEEFEKARQP